MNKHSFFIFLFLICSCQRAELNWGIVEGFFPSTDLLSEGIVNKYYIHSQSKDKMDISTHVIYRSFQVIDNKLQTKRFEPDFSTVFEKQFEFQNNQMILLEEKRFINKDTVNVTLVRPTIINWGAYESESKSEGEKTIHFEWGDVKIKKKQLESRDTSLLGLPAKIFVYEGSMNDYTSSDTSKISFQSKSIYVEGLGLFYDEYKDENETRWQELVEQIPLETFNKMSSVDRNRVAYIDPHKTLDNNESFEICNSKNRIYDYYNGDEITYYEGGKKEIWKIVSPLLQEDKTLNESGYLTFRFVINCKGEVGRVTTEQADLDFQRKQFDEITVNHFYQIFQQLNHWIPIRNREKATVDAYFYLTFKLKDGKLIELLP